MWKIPTAHMASSSLLSRFLPPPESRAMLHVMAPSHALYNMLFLILFIIASHIIPQFSLSLICFFFLLSSVAAARHDGIMYIRN